ncbi:MAG: hypothetical protein RML35_08400 [Chloroherpetonaceae bacterium]|nr:hypothetical protein [Chloroherpetonaceae bacterium]MDW8466179.1 hypothetical protein [Chloroherpetonaceae bacterium]
MFFTEVEDMRRYAVQTFHTVLGRYYFGTGFSLSWTHGAFRSSRLSKPEVE